MCTENQIKSILDDMPMCGGCGGGIWPDVPQVISLHGALVHTEGDCMENEHNIIMNARNDAAEEKLFQEAYRNGFN